MPPRGGRRPPSSRQLRSARRFDPRPRAGGDSHGRSRGQAQTSFDPRPRAGGDGWLTGTNYGWTFRSTPPRGGRRRQTRFAAASVSIHAPARGATMFDPTRKSRFFVSIHAPRGGRPEPVTTTSSRVARFDPRPRAGGDRQRLADVRADLVVSIHAPARGAALHSSLVSYEYGFRSTPPRGGDSHVLSALTAGGVSIHAPARGDWTSLSADRPTEFRSTPPRGGRLVTVSDVSAATDVSIHAPARGTTPPLPSHQRKGFRSTPRAGGDQVAFASGALSSLFRSTPPRGGRPFGTSPCRRRPFRSTPPRGGRPGSAAGAIRRYVSIHAPARGATRRARAPKV